MTTKLETKKYTLREARDQQGLTREQLSRKADVSVTSISRIEDGSLHQTKDEVAWKLCDALGLDINEVMWPRGITAQGRSSGTGTTATETFTRKPRPMCKNCFIELPNTLIFDECS